MAGKKKPQRGKRAGRKPEAGKPAAAKEKGRRAKGGPAARLLRRRAPEPLPTAPAVEARAVARYLRLSPQKARLVIDLIRGLDAGAALSRLQFTRKRAAAPIAKVLRSAIANAEQKSETVDVDHLYVKRAVVNDGPRMKRVRPAPYGRAYVYQRRMSHIEIAVAERKPGAGAPESGKPEAGKRAAAQAPPAAPGQPDTDKPEAGKETSR
ncbi:50S ribosomal protein L22 [Acidobacteriia bacterium AH_259_A11_L15]|nr:50S ribosomal protein L22 [Acidobacteriia bacterium AH_259_A11_L15]